MKPIDAVFEHGVFRPLEPVDLPEHSKVQVHTMDEAADRIIALKQPDEASLDRIYEILSRTCESGDPHGSERHNEHQP